MSSYMLTLFRLGEAGGGEGGGAESARAYFNFQELPWYLSNTNQIVVTFIEIYWETRFWKNFASRVSHVAMATIFLTPCLLNFDFFDIFVN